MLSEDFFDELNNTPPTFILAKKIGWRYADSRLSAP